MTERFDMTMEIDANGVLLVVFEGVYDGAEWLRLRREGFEGRYRLEDYDGRPIVTDMRRCLMPQRDWAGEFAAVAKLMRQERRKPCRRAIIVGSEAGAELAVSLFAEMQKVLHDPGVETRAFLDFDEGYAWALAGTPPPAGAPPKR